MAKSLNKVQLIGNLTRDPELKYTPQGTAVCTLGLATNRQWTTESGEKKDEADFHRLVAWSKLAEICAQLLKKGRKIYVEGRLQTRSWQAQDGTQRSTTEVVLSDMIILDKKDDVPNTEINIPDEAIVDAPVAEVPVKKEKKKITLEDTSDSEDIPF
ncbi:MAG: single-stranded DNA-binding protein [Patescibacteria group bacterium]